MNFQSTLKSVKLLTAALATTGLVACGTQAPQPQQQATMTPEIPDWVMNPIIENGIADTQCVAANPGVGMNYLKSQATSLGRAELAKQIDIKVKAMDKTYQRLSDTKEGSSVGGSFESVSKQVTEKNLAGSRAIKMGYVTMPDNTQNFCVMMAMSPEVTKTLFNDLISESGTNVSPQNESVLYERFLAEKAQKEMEAEFQSN